MSELADLQSDRHAVTFQAPTDLVAKLDKLAAREMMTRATLLRRLAAKAVDESGAAAA
jgi:hypothetical protein